MCCTLCHPEGLWLEKGNKLLLLIGVIYPELCSPVAIWYYSPISCQLCLGRVRANFRGWKAGRRPNNLISSSCGGGATRGGSSGISTVLQQFPLSDKIAVRTEMDPAAAARWCREENVLIGHGLVIGIKGENWTEEQLLSVLRTYSKDRKLWVMDMRTDTTNQHTYALCEWKKGVPDHFKGTSIKTIDQVELFLIHPEGEEEDPIPTTTGGLSTEESAKKEGFSAPPLTTLSSELCAVLGEIVAKCNKDPPNYLMAGYRKLRTFSGKQPVPSVEDGFEEWLDNATQALEEWEIPEQHKKQRITESLKGPALEAVRNLKLSKKDCTAQDYLDILQDVFGRTEKVTELLYQLEHCYQKEGEKLSEFIGRLDRIIHQILLKKGLDPRKVDETRAQQVLRGAQPLDPIAILLRTRQDGGILEYPDLIRMVREEEVMLDNKRKSQERETTARVRVISAEEGDSQVELLKTQVSQLIEMVSILNSQASALSNRNTEEKPAKHPSSSVEPEQKPRRPITCFNCGGVGHVRGVCPSPEEAAFKHRKPAENFRGLR